MIRGLLAKDGWRGDLTGIARAFVADAGRGPAIGALGLMLGAALAEALTLALLAPLIALLTGSGSGRVRHAVDRIFALVGVADPTRRIAMLMMAMVAMVALRSLVLAARDLKLGALRHRFIDHLRTGLIRRVAGSGWQAFLALRHARVAQALAEDIPRTALCLHLMLSVALSLVMLAAQWLVVVVLTPGLAAFVAIGGAIGAFLAMPMMRRARDLGVATRRGKLRLLDTTGQLMGGLKLAVAQNLAGAFVDEFDATQAELSREQQAFEARRNRGQAWNSVGFAAALALTVLGGQWLRVPVAPLIASLAILARMAGPFVGLIRDAREIAGALPSWRSLGELAADLPGGDPRLATPSGDVGTGDATALDGPLRFEGAGFTHRGAAQPTLAPIDLTLAPGQIVGITGPSGAGKTSFVDLACGLLAPAPGRLTAGTTPLTPERLPAWRERIAYVGQDAYLFNDSVRRNLAWGRADLPDEQVWEALALADAVDLVRAMPGGLDAGVAERGARLSGGERQRLALARAILRRPRLLILDEATNAIGIDAEAAILARLLPALGGATVLIVTHRPETLRFCDRVLTFGDGGLVGDRRGPVASGVAA